MERVVEDHGQGLLDRAGITNRWHAREGIGQFVSESTCVCAHAQAHAHTHTHTHTHTY